MRRTILAALGCTALAACATDPQIKDVTPPIDWDLPATNGHYKVGKPYKIGRTYYYPAEDYAYSETGVASWYGQKFHKKKTANGERFDMDRLSAAHRTLPMPSAVRVTNLENGYSIVLRVNDRGPFARGRIIDLSRRAAQLLGFERKGTARVRVTILADESRRLAMLAKRGRISKAERIAPPPGPPASVSVEPLEDSEQPVQTASADPDASLPPPGPKGKTLEEDPRMEFRPVRQTQLYVQAGSFVKYRNASRLRSRLSRFGSAEVAPAQIGSERFYRVRLGPISSVDAADRILSRVVRAGYPSARLIVD